jgi:ankyrin repeat protein
VVALLIDAGADVNAGTRPSAAVNAIITKLPAHVGSNAPKMKAIRPSTHPAALFAAIENGHTDVAALLIDAGADVNTRYERHDAVSLARSEGQVDMIELLEAAARLPSASNLIDAAQTSDWERVSTVVERGADVNAQGDRGWTALMYAVRAGDVELVSTLLDRGADVNAQTDNGETALVQAASRGDEAVVELLLDAGADVNATTEHGSSALYFAVRAGHEGVAELLRAAGAEG